VWVRRTAKPPHSRGFLLQDSTGATGLEPATPGFGDRCATNCATPLGCAADCIRLLPEYHRAVPMVALFSAITLAFALIAVWTAAAGKYPLAVAAAALAVWMATLAWSALRKTRS
jgi:hypothetical protein